MKIWPKKRKLAIISETVRDRAKRSKYSKPCGFTTYKITTWKYPFCGHMTPQCHMTSQMSIILLNTGWVAFGEVLVYKGIPVYQIILFKKFDCNFCRACYFKSVHFLNVTTLLVKVLLKQCLFLSWDNKWLAIHYDGFKTVLVHDIWQL